MTRTTTLSLLTAVALLGGAASASAAGVHVRIAGRSQADISHDVAMAAERVCKRAVETDVLDEFPSQEECVAATVKATMQKLAANTANYDVAQADLPAAR